MPASSRTGSAALAGALCALLLAACQAQPQPAPPPDTATQDETAVEAAPDASAAEAAPEPSAEAAPAPAPPETATPVTTAAAQPTVPAPAEAARPPEPEIDADPGRLLGLDSAGVTAILGPPELMRREPPAEVWQYRGATCVLDVFLYEEAEARRVTYLEARDNTASPIETRPCLRELLRARLDETSG